MAKYFTRYKNRNTPKNIILKMIIASKAARKNNTNLNFMIFVFSL